MRLTPGAALPPEGAGTQTPFPGGRWRLPPGLLAGAPAWEEVRLGPRKTRVEPCNLAGPRPVLVVGPVPGAGW